jgi:glycosyltransferase involved in cell wall biosynthesis
MSRVALLGVRGVPNRYGGFERLVEVLAPHLARLGHEVTVYCEGGRQPPADDLWQGVRRRFIRVGAAGPRGTLAYDARAFADVGPGSVALVFGYGSAVYQALLRRRGVPHAVNMDGLEWQREKWGLAARSWLRLNERVAARLADRLVADHPVIQQDLAQRLGARSTMIAYGVDPVPPPDGEPPLPGLVPQGYLLAIARPEPENQLHLLLQAHEIAGGPPLVVVGDFGSNDYGRQLVARHPGARFVGPLYDKPLLDRLRGHCRLYLHGHRVGGTNPSLIEAMAAGAAVLAHDNPFNRWVLGDGGGWTFRGLDDLVGRLREPPSPDACEAAGRHARARCLAQFRWADILGAYARLVDELQSCISVRVRS